MKEQTLKPTTIDEYIAQHPAEVRDILQQIRQTIQQAAPDAQERISYQLPAFSLNGPLVYFGAFKKHIGFYPPIRDEQLKAEAAIYAGEKGNLRFPLDQPMPYDLIRRLVLARIQENVEIATARKQKKMAGKN